MVTVGASELIVIGVIGALLVGVPAVIIGVVIFATKKKK